MKGYDQRGFVFYTNYSSRKGQELQRNSYASLCFWWEPLHRSVCLPCDPQSSAVQYAPSMKCTHLTQTLYRAVCDVLLPSATRSSGRTSARVSVYHNEVGCALLSKLTGRKVQSWHCRYLCGVVALIVFITDIKPGQSPAVFTFEAVKSEQFWNKGLSNADVAEPP